MQGTDLWEVCWAFVAPFVECAIRGTPKWRYANKWFGFGWYSLWPQECWHPNQLRGLKIQIVWWVALMSPASLWAAAVLQWGSKLAMNSEIICHRFALFSLDEDYIWWWKWWALTMNIMMAIRMIALSRVLKHVKTTQTMNPCSKMSWKSIFSASGSVASAPFLWKCELSWPATVETLLWKGNQI